MTLTDLDLLLLQLDRTPDDRLLLGAIADCCDDRDGSGAGWRALVLHDRHPHYWDGSGSWGWIDKADFASEFEWSQRCNLPTDWFRSLPLPVGNWCWATDGTPKTGSVKAFSAAANAFLCLPIERQQELLEGRL